MKKHLIGLLAVTALLAAAAVRAEVPTPVTGLIATSTTPTSTILNWVASSTDSSVVAFKIFQNNAQIATTSATTSSYSINNLTPTTTYIFGVASLSSTSESSLLSTTSVTTLALPTPTPTTSASSTLKIAFINTDKTNPFLNLNANKTVKIVVYGSREMNVRSLKPNSATFGGAKTDGYRLKDVNKDGIMDRIFDFKTRRMNELKNATGTVQAKFSVTNKANAKLTANLPVTLKSPAVKKPEIKKHDDERKNDNDSNRKAINKIESKAITAIDKIIKKVEQKIEKQAGKNGKK